MKYGFLTILRTPLKTITFFLLIAAVTVFLSLGAGMWQSAENMLNEADEVFATVGEFAFTGGGYPDSKGFDEELSAAAENFDLSALESDEVKFIEENITQRAYLGGFNQIKNNMPYAGYSLITVNVRSYYEEYDAYSAIVEKVYYSSDSTLENKMIYITGYDGFEQGQRYAVFGYASVMPYQQFLRFEVVSFENSPFVSDSEGVSPLYRISDYGMIKDFTESREGEFFSETGKTLEVLNNSVDVVPAGDVKTVYGFHSGEYRLIEGRYFNNNEENVCIISKRIAGQLKLSVGDSIKLDFHYPTGKESRYSSYLTETGFLKENVEYTIAGIYQTDELVTTVFVSDAGQEWLERSENDYVLARVSLDNRRAENYIKNINGKLPDGVSFKVYDQGYRAAVLSVNSLRETAFMIITLCLALCILILWFFGFLFIFRNEQSARVLLALGAGKRRVAAFFLTGSGVIAGTAAVLGVAAGYLVSGSIFSAVYDSIETNSVYDFRYSTLGYGAGNTVFKAEHEINIIIYILAAAAVTLMSLLFCLFFSAGVIKKQDPRRKFKTREKTEKSVKPASEQKTPKSTKDFGFTMLLPATSLRYSAKSILRGGRRSVIVPVLFAFMLFFISLFYNMHNGFQKNLETVYDDIPVSLKFSDVSGKKTDGLTVTSLQTDKMRETGFTDKEWKSFNKRFMFNGIVELADGTVPENPAEPYIMPSNVYSREIMMNQWNIISDQNILLTLSSGITAFENAAEFMYTDVPEIEWAEGLSEEIFFGKEDVWQYIIASDKFMEKYNLSLGDRISEVMIDEAEYFIAGYDWSYGQTEFIIAGTYKSYSDKPMTYIYYPWDTFSGVYEYDRVTEEVKLVYSIYNAAGFMLKDTSRLSAFKDILEEFIDPIGKGGQNRVWVVIDDAALYDTIDRLNRYIGYMNVLYPVVLAVVTGIGFLISHLLLKSRTGEIAVLRGLGASRITVFFSYFNEQFLLSLAGAVIGLSAAAFTGTISPVNVLLLAVCYYAGLSAAIMQSYRKAAMEALSLKEQ